MTNRNPDHDDRDRDRDHDRDHDNDNDQREGKAIAPAAAAGALTSLAALQTALNGVDTSRGGRTGQPMMLFKSRESTWMYGQKGTVPEDGSRWAANPMTFMWGFINFSNDNKLAGERIVPVSQPKPDVAALPDKGTPWAEEWTVNMKCIDGADAGTEVVFKTTTDGGIKAVSELIDTVRNRLNEGRHDDKVVPIVHLEKDSYQNGQYGRIWFPVFTIVDWMPLSGPAPAPEPAAPPPPPSPPPSTTTEQPRRRRVA